MSRCSVCSDTAVFDGIERLTIERCHRQSYPATVPWFFCASTASFSSPTIKDHYAYYEHSHTVSKRICGVTACVGLILSAGSLCKMPALGRSDGA